MVRAELVALLVDAGLAPDWPESPAWARLQTTCDNPQADRVVDGIKSLARRHSEACSLQRRARLGRTSSKNRVAKLAQQYRYELQQLGSTLMELLCYLDKYRGDGTGKPPAKILQHRGEALLRIVACARVLGTYLEALNTRVELQQRARGNAAAMPLSEVEKNASRTLGRSSGTRGCEDLSALADKKSRAKDDGSVTSNRSARAESAELKVDDVTALSAEQSGNRDHLSLASPLDVAAFMDLNMPSDARKADADSTCAGDASSAVTSDVERTSGAETANEEEKAPSILDEIGAEDATAILSANEEKTPKAEPIIESNLLSHNTDESEEQIVSKDSELSSTISQQKVGRSLKLVEATTSVDSTDAESSTVNGASSPTLTPRKERTASLRPSIFQSPNPEQRRPSRWATVETPYTEMVKFRNGSRTGSTARKAVSDLSLNDNGPKNVLEPSSFLESYGFEKPVYENPDNLKLAYKTLQRRGNFSSSAHWTPPPGVDPRNREAYLTDADFMDVFGVDRIAFSEQPKWRQQARKKDLGLF